jgi:hypothetical protein
MTLKNSLRPAAALILCLAFGAAMLTVMTVARVVLASPPILILVGLPAWLLVRYRLRRNRRNPAA